MPGETNIQLRLIVREFNGCRSSLLFEIYLESDQKLNESAFVARKLVLIFAVIYIPTLEEEGHTMQHQVLKKFFIGGMVSSKRI